MLVSSHVLAEVAQIADDVVIIPAAGSSRRRRWPSCAARVAGAGRASASPEVGRLRELLGAAGIAVTPLEPDGLTADTSPEQIGEVAAANGIVLHELVAEAASLEEASSS